MSSPGDSSSWEALHLLAEPTRRKVYLAVRDARSAMTRDEVAQASGVNRRLATFHLDLLADAGLLTTDYARPEGRSGPGAGRPAKRYQAKPIDLELSLPTRRYDVAARILARAINEARRGEARAHAARVAHDEGVRVGTLRRPGRRLSATATLQVAADVLADLGYEPAAEGDCVRLRNCPFHAVVDVAPELVCGVNDALVGGLLDGLGGHRSVTARLEGTPPDCCVTVARR